MLDEPDPGEDDLDREHERERFSSVGKTARQKELRRERKRRLNRRKAAKLACCTVEYDGITINFLVATHWLKEADTADPKKIGAAVTAMLRKTARENN